MLKHSLYVLGTQLVQSCLASPRRVCPERAVWHPLNMHKPIVTTPSRRSSTIARYTVLGSLVFCTHFALVVIASIVLTRFWLICPLLMKPGAIAYKW